MISHATDYMPIATWVSGDCTYVIQVETLQERPVGVFISSDSPRYGSADVRIPTEKNLVELIGFWNHQSVEERTRAAEEELGAGNGERGTVGRS